MQAGCRLKPSSIVTLVGFIGRAGTGKDTAAAHLCAHYGFVRVAFADAIKNMLEVHLADRGIDHAYLHEPGWKNEPIPGIGLSARELMQRQGDAFRAADPMYWVATLADVIGLRGKPAVWQPVHDRIVISDVRYPNEQGWVSECGGTLVRLVRECAEPVRAHSSEQHADYLPADHTLVNNGPSLYGLHSLLDGTMAAIGIDQREPVNREA